MGFKADWLHYADFMELKWLKSLHLEGLFETNENKTAEEIIAQ